MSGWRVRRDGAEEWLPAPLGTEEWGAEEFALDYAETLWHSDLPDVQDGYVVEVLAPAGDISRWRVEVRAVPEFRARPL